MSLNFDPTKQSSNVRFELNANSPKGSKKTEGADNEDTISSASEVKPYISSNWFSNAASKVVNAVKTVFSFIWKLISSVFCCSNPQRSLESFLRSKPEDAAKQFANNPSAVIEMFLDAGIDDPVMAQKILADNVDALDPIIGKFVEMRAAEVEKTKLDKFVADYKKANDNKEPEEKTLEKAKEAFKAEAQKEVMVAFKGLAKTPVQSLKVIFGEHRAEVVDMLITKLGSKAYTLWTSQGWANLANWILDLAENNTEVADKIFGEVFGETVSKTSKKFVGKESNKDYSDLQ